ncbi:MAG TPA: RES family NAD+ phosphorylase [Hanamia sp.]|nr:RES family NAD+ phosphorylase [Hanamia sp.]
MELYRITQREFSEDLTGNGARLFGGRWNSEGFFALYTSSSRSLALLETLAHTPAKMLSVRVYHLITLSVPDNLQTQKISVKNLQLDWDAADTRPFTQKLGDSFLAEKKYLVMEVPSVMMPEEINYVINPLHQDMKQVKLVSKRRIYFDKRINL